MKSEDISKIHTALEFSLFAAHNEHNDWNPWGCKNQFCVRRQEALELFEGFVKRGGFHKENGLIKALKKISEELPKTREDHLYERDERIDYLQSIAKDAIREIEDG